MLDPRTKGAEIRKNMSLLLIRLLKISVIIFILWGCGFLFFYAFVIFGTGTPATKQSGAIAVVFTGDHGRIERGLTSLKEKKAKILFISGLTSQTHHQKIQSPHESQIILGEKGVKNTWGNIRDLKQWSETQPDQTFLLITSDYHVPRCRLLLRTFLPSLNYAPLAITGNRRHIQKTFKEYIKLTYLVCVLPFLKHSAT